MSQELEYVMVESGQAPTLENNLLPNIILLTTGEANYTNSQLQQLNCTQVYLKLETESEDGE